MFQSISSKSYDPLDHRRPEFDADYADFKKQQAETEQGLYKFLRSEVTRCTSIHDVLVVLSR